MRSNEQLDRISRPAAVLDRRPAPATVAEPEHEPWYRFGVAFQYMELLIAVGVTLFSLYMALSGTGGFPGK